MRLSARPAALFVACSTGLLAPAQPSATVPASPAVYLNHFFVVISPESYAAILKDPYLTGPFAPFEKRTTARSDTTYTGAYWYGRRTYFEVFEPPSQGPMGSSGVAFSVDGAGESAAIKTAWAASLGAAETSPVTRRTETAEPAWFHITYSRGGAPGLRLWLMEYHRDFLAGWYPELTPARGTSRAEVLDRYVAKIGRSKERDSAVFGDITSLVLALDEAERESLRRHLLPVGWTASGREAEGSLTGPEGLTLKVTGAGEGRRGIVEARFSVQGRPRPHVATLGKARLEVAADAAVLRFAP